VIVQRQLYGSNIPAAITPEAARCPPEEEDTEDVALAMVEAEAQHQLLLPVPHQSLLEPVQN
jgi:hypothetical protein